MLLWSALGCGLATSQDLWLDVQIKESPQIDVHLPANWMLDAEEPLTIETPDGSIDLRDEARQLNQSPVRGSRSWTLDERTKLTLRELKPGKAKAERIRVGASGPRGFGLGIGVPLNPNKLGPVRTAFDANLDVHGLEVDYGTAFCEQLARSAPTTLLKVTGGKGGGFTVATE